LLIYKQWLWKACLEKFGGTRFSSFLANAMQVFEVAISNES